MSQPDTASTDPVRTFKARERWFGLLLFCVVVPILVAVGVVSGDRPVDTPWQIAVIAVGLPAMGVAAFGFWRSTVSVTPSEVIVWRLFITNRYRRSEVRAVARVGAGEFQSAVLVIDHDLPFPSGQPTIPLLAGSGLVELAGLLGVPFVTEDRYRAFLSAREQADVDLEQFEAEP